MPDETLMNRIERERLGLSRALAVVARFVLEQPQAFMQMSLAEIAETSGISEPTVIRFCRHLGYAGVAEFRIALAIDLAGHPDRSGTRPPMDFLEPAVMDKAVVNLPQKAGIARAARQLVARDRSIIVDSGSTGELFARSLGDAQPLLIMTCGLNVMEALRHASQHRVMLPGGTVRYASMSLTGPLVGETVRDMYFDTFFLGADAIDPDFGVSTFNEGEAHQNAALMRIARKVVLLADSSKFRTPALHRIAGLTNIRTIVTDSGIPDAIARKLGSLGIEVISAEPCSLPAPGYLHPTHRNPT